jgi:prepilin-type N-terminal cleavage/methylation domain-containing protein
MRSNRFSRKAFTLIELLVAITVTAVMVGMMITILNNVLNSWNRSTATLTSGNQARVLLDQISTDLQSLVLRQDGNAWLIATMQQDQTTASGDTASGTSDVFLARWNTSAPTTYKPRGANSFDPAANRTNATKPSLNVDLENHGKLEYIRFGQAGVWLRFFSIPPDNNKTLGSTTVSSDITAPVAVSYQLTRAHIGGDTAARTTPISYILFRSVVSPDKTFDADYDLLVNDNPGYNAPNGKDGEPGNVRKPSASHVIANDVIDFGVRIYHRNAAGALVEAFPATRDAGGTLLGEPLSAPYSYVATSAASPSYTLFGGSAVKTVGGMPEVIDVMVRILTPEGVRQIRAYEENPTLIGATASDEKWWEIAEANSKVYTRRIEIQAKVR